jgi:hypothetical protein
MKNSFFKTLVAGILFSVLVNCVRAQTFLFQGLPQQKSQIGLRFMRPDFKYGSDLSTLSGIYDFSVNIPLSQNLNLVGSIPYMTFKFENFSESGVGNIFIGLQTHSGFNKGKSSAGSFGLYLPTSGEDICGLFGAYTHFIDYAKYVTDLLTFYGNYSYVNRTPKGFRLGVEIGPDLVIPTGDGGDTDFLIHYGFTFGFQDENFAVLSELMGLVIITEEADDFGDRFLHSLDFGFTYLRYNVKPGIFYKLYLKDDFSDIVEGVLGIKVDVTVD